MAALDFTPILAALAKEGRGFSVWLLSAARSERRVVDVEPDGSILVWLLDEYSVPVMLVGSAVITPCGLAQDPGGFGDGLRRPCRIGQGVHQHHQVETGVLERQRVHVGLAHLDVAQPAQASAGGGHHARAGIDADVALGVRRQQFGQHAVAENPMLEQEMARLSRDYENAQLRYRDLKEKKMAADMDEQMIQDRKGQRLSVVLAAPGTDMETALKVQEQVLM